MASARVVTWPGGVTEVQLPKRRSGGASAADDEAAETAALVRAAVEQAAAEERGELRRVRKPRADAAPQRKKGDTGDATPPPPPPAAPGTPPPEAAAASACAPRRRTTATDYAGFELALARAGDSDGDGDGGSGSDDSDWVLQAVPPEERAAEAARRAALAAAEAARERGNEAYKRGDFAAARAAYGAGLRHAPSAALLSNRAAASLALGEGGAALRDARAALALDPTHLKAAVRAARALQVDDAAAEARAASRRAPRDGDLKRLARELEAAAAQASYERGLLRCAALHAACDATALADAEAALSLPPGASSALADVVAAAERAAAAAAGDAAAGRALAASLPKLREALRATSRCRDALAAAGGVAQLLAAYAEDNAGVLTALAEACGASERCAAALAAACDSLATSAKALPTLLGAFRDRRLAVIAPAVQLLAAAAPGSRATRAELCAEPYAETVVLMALRAPPQLAAKALALLAALADADARALAAAMAPHKAAVAEALARGMAGASVQSDAPRRAAPPPLPAQPQRHAVAVASALARASGALRTALGANARVAAALLTLLFGDACAVPATRTLDFASGATLTWRAWPAASQGALSGLTATAALAARLAGPALAAAWEAMSSSSSSSSSSPTADGDAWAILLPLMAAPAAIASPAAVALAACAEAEEGCSAALAELGVAEVAMDLIQAHMRGSIDAAGGNAAAALLRRCAAHPALVRELLSGGSGDDGRGLPRTCALLTSPAASHAAVAAACAAALAAGEADHGAARYMAEQRPRFAADCVAAWFGRAGGGDDASTARDALEAVIVACLSSDAGADALTRDADSQEHVLGFVAALRSRRAATMARRTGGASMLNPAAVGMRTPYASAAPGAAGNMAAPHPDAEHGEALNAIDAPKLARYVATLLPAGAAIAALATAAAPTFGAGATLLDLSGGGAALAARLAVALPGATVYAAERSRGACDAAAAAGGPNLAPLYCGNEGSLDAVPLPAHAAVAALLSTLQEAEEVAQLLMALPAKLREGGALLIVEEEPEAMATMRAVAERAGFAAIATPEVLNAHFVCVMRAL